MPTCNTNRNISALSLAKEMKASVMSVDKTITIAKYLHFKDERQNINGAAWIL
jgi:hypothetical protein